MSSLPLHATSLTFGYVEAEDRLACTAANASGATVTMLLTRRFTGRLINGLAGVVERSSLTASRAPAELRDDVILLERHEALLSAPANSQAQASRKSENTGGQRKAHLVQAVDVKTTPATFELVFRDKRGPLIHLTLDRALLHRVIERISRQAEAAAWNLTIAANWLDPGQGEIVLN